MRKDLGEILPLYQSNTNLARELLYWTFPLIFWDVLKKKWIRLNSQDLYTRDDLLQEAFMEVDTFLYGISNNYNCKPMYKKRVIIGYDNSKVLSLKEIKWYVYQIIARTIRDRATEKWCFRVPFTKDWVAALVIKHWTVDWLDVYSINKEIWYNESPEFAINFLQWPSVEFGYDKELENQYLMNIIYKVTDRLDYEDKKLFVQRYRNWQSIESIAREMKIWKLNMLKKIRALNDKIREAIKEEWKDLY